MTDYVARLEKLESFLLIISFIACVFITFAFAYFAFRFRRKEEKEQGQAKQHHNLPFRNCLELYPFCDFYGRFCMGLVSL